MQMILKRTLHTNNTFWDKITKEKATNFNKKKMHIFEQMIIETRNFYKQNTSSHTRSIIMRNMSRFRLVCRLFSIAIQINESQSISVTNLFKRPWKVERPCFSITRTRPAILVEARSCTKDGHTPNLFNPLITEPWKDNMDVIFV